MLSKHNVLVHSQFTRTMLNSKLVTVSPVELCWSVGRSRVVMKIKCVVVFHVKAFIHSG